ncbi:MAG: DUF6596 domain-containing protein [Planctomycetota bacterium]
MTPGEPHGAGSDAVDCVLERVLRESRPELVGALARRAGGDLFRAEDALGEAVSDALVAWGQGGLPERPLAWLFAVAARRLVDDTRARVRADDAHWTRARETPAEAPAPDEAGTPDADDALRLLFVCCHAALSPESRVALTLNAALGVDAASIAAAFLVEPGAMARRVTRAKEKVRDAGIEFELPPPAERDERIGEVIKVVELLFHEGSFSARGQELGAVDLSAEGLRLADALARLRPDDPEVLGLLALVLFTRAREAARVDQDGRLVLLRDQDRERWDRAAIDRGRAALGRAVRLGGEGRYVLRAALAAEHSCAPSAESTNWPRIVELYDALLELEPSPVVALNRAVAVGEVSGPEAMLEALDALKDGAGARSHYFHAARADALEKLGRSEESRTALRAAVNLAQNAVERAELERRL